MQQWQNHWCATIKHPNPKSNKKFLCMEYDLIQITTSEILCGVMIRSSTLNYIDQIYDDTNTYYFSIKTKPTSFPPEKHSNSGKDWTISSILTIFYIIDNVALISFTSYCFFPLHSLPPVAICCLFASFFNKEIVKVTVSSNCHLKTHFVHLFIDKKKSSEICTGSIDATNARTHLHTIFRFLHTQWF